MLIATGIVVGMAACWFWIMYRLSRAGREAAYRRWRRK